MSAAAPIPEAAAADIDSPKAEVSINPPSTEETANRRFGPVAIFATIVISLCVIGLAIVGWYAWQQGYLEFSLPSGPPEQQAGTLGGVTAEVVPADAFSSMVADGKKKYKPFRTVVEELSEQRTYYAGCSVPPARDEGWTATEYAALDQLAAMGGELLEAYESYVQLARKNDGERYADSRLIIQSEFARLFVLYYEQAGNYYAGDVIGVHAAYTASDTHRAKLDELGGVETLLLKETWQNAIYNREQFLLDRQLDEEYRQLQARFDASAQLHDVFRETVSAIPDYNVRRGRIPGNAEDLLSVLDSYAFSLAELGLELLDFETTLDPVRISGSFEMRLGTYRNQLQSRHLSCFREVYKIYARDKYLEHEAYWNLEQHLAFVEEYWPLNEPDYRDVINRYTADWDRAWRGD